MEMQKIGSWSSEEDQIIRDNYLQLPFNKISKILERNASTVKSRAKKLGLSKYNDLYKSSGFKQGAWTAEEDQYLLDNWSKILFTNISKYLNRNRQSIYHRAQRLGLKRTSEEQITLLGIWPPEEEKYLIDNWTTQSAGSISQSLNRSVSSVNNKAQKLNLTRTAEQRKAIRNAWTDSEIKQLTDTIYTMPFRELAFELGRTLSAVKSKAQELGLIRSASDIFRKHRESSPEMPVNFFPSREWTPDEDKYLITNWATKSTQQIANDLNRTYHSVKLRQTKLGIKKTNEQIRLVRTSAWTTEEDSYIISNQNQTDKELGRALNRTPYQIRDRAAKLGIVIQKATNNGKKTLSWTRAEDQYLIDHLPEGRKAIAKALGRTLCSIHARLILLRKNSPNSNHLAPLATDKSKTTTLQFSEAERAYIRANWGNKTGKQIAKEIGRHPRSIYKEAHKMGLKKTEVDLKAYYLSNHSLSDARVLHTITKDPELMQEVVKMPNLIKLKRLQLILNRKLKQL